MPPLTALSPLRTPAVVFIGDLLNHKRHGQGVAHYSADHSEYR